MSNNATIDINGGSRPRKNARGDIIWKLPTNMVHRIDGPAIEYHGGDKEWAQNGKRHRTDGPAVDWADGTEEWYLNGKRHRTDGPAVEHPDGRKEWWINDIQLDQFTFWLLVNEQGTMRSTDLMDFDYSIITHTQP
jgi:hypothetical protein